MYKINFTETEKNIFNTIERETTRKSLMSIYSYLLKYADEETLKTEIQFSKLHKMYIRYHERLALSTLKKKIKKLAEIGLIIVQKTKNGINSYAFTRFNKLEKGTTNVTCGKVIEPTDITEFESNDNLPKYINNNYIKDIDSNSDIITFTESCDNFDYDKYLEEEQKADEETVIKTAHKLFRAMKVSSSFIKANVIAKLTKYANTITVKHLETYIAKAIANARVDSERNYKKYVLSNNYKPAKKLRFNDYEQRSYDYDSLEDQLRAASMGY